MDAQLAPEFPQALDWLNVAEPLRMGALRGQPVVLAFATPGAAWSRRMLDDLAQLLGRHAGRVQGAAILLPRFDHERDRRKVEALVQRSGVALPVALDADWHAWQQYDLQAWPTVVIVDAEGTVRERIVGACDARELDRRVAPLLGAVQPERGIPLRRLPQPSLPLRFPVGIAVDANYLYIADSGHHRILECDHAGRILRQFGSGDPNFLDGPPESSAFRRPRGLSLQRDVLYVADAGNHAVRRIRVRTGDTETLCGSGFPGDARAGIVVDPRARSLDAPVAVQVAGDGLAIACAGDNRIWRFNLGNSELSLLAGSGRLGVVDGSDFSAAFAEPTALAAVQQLLYVCDGAGSAIRSVNLRSGKVSTLLGKDAWNFGQVDGARGTAQLQHPQAIALDPGAPVLWIADTGNDALRTLRMGGGELATHPLPQPLHGPAGLAVANGSVWIADTDAHAILRLDLQNGAMHHIPVGE